MDEPMIPMMLVNVNAIFPSNDATLDGDAIPD